MAKRNIKYFQLLCNLFILSGINILKVIASTDCEIFNNSVTHFDREFRLIYKEFEGNCCSFKDITCDEDSNIISM